MQQHFHARSVATGFYPVQLFFETYDFIEQHEAIVNCKHQRLHEQPAPFRDVFLYGSAKRRFSDRQCRLLVVELQVIRDHRPQRVQIAVIVSVEEFRRTSHHLFMYNMYMDVGVSQFRRELFALMAKAQAGEPVTVVHKGERFRIVPERAVDRLSNLTPMQVTNPVVGERVEQDLKDEMQREWEKDWGTL